MMKVQNSSGNFRIDGLQVNGQTAGRTPPTDPRVSTYSLARAIEEMGAAMVFPRDAEIYRENSPGYLSLQSGQRNGSHLKQSATQTRCTDI